MYKIRLILLLRIVAAELTRLDIGFRMGTTVFLASGKVFYMGSTSQAYQNVLSPECSSCEALEFSICLA